MTPKIRNYILAGAVVIGAVLLIAGLSNKGGADISADTLIQGDYAIPANSTLHIKNGATLTVQGKLDVSGTLNCDNGPLNIVAKGGAVISGTLECASQTNQTNPSGINLVATNGLTLTKTGTLTTDASIQIVTSADKLAATPDKLEELYADAADNSGKGPRLGPIVPSTDGPASSKNKTSGENLLFNNILKSAAIQSAQAQAILLPIVLSGTIRLTRPPGKNVHQIIAANVPDTSGLTLQDLTLEGPAGQPGASDLNQACSAKGKDGADAFRLLVTANDLVVKNVNLKLGNGGKGGDAQTKSDCGSVVTAQGGNGGQAGNFKMIGSHSFQIEGAFNITPGVGGAGGFAKAQGRNASAPGDKGGDAIARGGNGANNTKTLALDGTVNGLASVSFGPALGGAGGPATALAGNGAAASDCGKTGGDGGNAAANAGKGGDAKLTVSGAGRTAAQDTGGNGGDASSIAGSGANGGDCGPKGAGGNGGQGGSAQAVAGAGGKAQVIGHQGAQKATNGGNGGNGGSGCGPGSGGKGGAGLPPGTDGQVGTKVCPDNSTSSTTGNPPPSGQGPITNAEWSQPQACPQYGAPNNCYNPEGSYGGYDNWVKTRATFIWNINPCPKGKKVVGINSTSCVYETPGTSGTAISSAANGEAVVDCRQFAAQYKADECNCNNGITLHANVQCQ